MQQDLDEAERLASGDQSDRINRQKFVGQPIRSGRGAAQDGDAGMPQLARNDAYVFERGSYAPQGVEPNYEFLDSRIVENLQEASIPFPIRKMMKNRDEEEGGAWYIFGTRLVLIREYDDETLMLKEYKSASDQSFDAYIASETEPEWRKIQNLLRTRFQHLLNE